MVIERKRAESKAPRINLVDYYDSSDEEDLRNTIGNIPVSWYDELDHIGYDKDGQQIKSKQKAGEVDEFLEKMDNPNYWRKIYDRQSGGFITLSDEQVERLNAIKESKYPIIGYNPYQPFLDIFSSKTEIHPISNRPESKKSFIPSLDEKRLVGKMVHAIKMGWAKPVKPKKLEKEVYDLWNDEPSSVKTKNEKARIRMHFQAPKLPTPSHIESYNPPEEYLFDDDELKKWEDMDPEDRRLDFIPKKYNSLREVPTYDRFYNDRYQRCLDLYLAPRQQRMKLNVDISQLLPELPNLEDMRPFPTTLSFYMRGHIGQVRSLSFESGCSEIFASGGEDGFLRFWSVMDGRCVKAIDFKSPITCVAFCPAVDSTVLAVTAESSKIFLTNSLCGYRHDIASTSQRFALLKDQNSEGNSSNWTFEEDRIVINLSYLPRRVVWHHKGDYFATFALSQSPKSVQIHQLSNCKSQRSFSRVKGVVSGISFHPCEPLFFVATQRHVRIYDLSKCQMKKKILTGSKGVSALQVDTFGGNLFVGGHDRSFSWIDLQLSNKPWKNVRHHAAAIRAVTQHPKYPLVATVSDDSTAIVYYARTSQDPLKDNEFVPVRKLRAHTPQKNGLSILDVIFHPSQAWLITSGADGLIALFT